MVTNKILQWEPEKSRFWGTAKIGNIERVRQDLAALGEAIQGKADTAALSVKADLQQLLDLKKLVQETRTGLESLAQQVESEINGLGAKLNEFTSSTETARTASQAALAQCQGLAESFESRHRAIEATMAEALAKAEEHVNAVSTHATQTAATVTEIRSLNAECVEIRQTVLAKAGELESLSAQAQSAAETAAQSLSGCRAAVEQNQELHARLQTEHTEAAKQLGELRQQTELHATAASQNANLAATASEVAATAKTNCEGVLESLKARAEQLGAGWTAMHQNVLEVAGTTEQQLARATEVATQAQTSSAQCQDLLREIQQLRANAEAAEKQLAERLSAAEKLAEQAAQHANASSEHLKACEAVQAAVTKTDNELRRLSQNFTEQARQSYVLQQQAQDLNNRVEQQFASLRAQGGSFGKRLRWLFLGPR